MQAENRPDLQVWMLHAIHAAGREDLSPKAKEATRKAWEQLWREKDTPIAYGRALLTLVAHHSGLEEGGQALGATIGKWRDSGESRGQDRHGPESAQETPNRLLTGERMARFVTGPMVASRPLQWP